jgi:hypothetical protein
MPLSMKSPQRCAKVRELIEAELPEDGVLYEVSEGKWVLDAKLRGPLRTGPQPRMVRYHMLEVVVDVTANT